MQQPTINSTAEAELLFYEANQLLNDNKISEGYNLLVSLAEKYPDFGKTYNHLGWIYDRKFKDTKNAEIYYKKAMKLSPNYPAVYMNYAYLLSDLARYDELEAHLNKALKIEGINQESLFNEMGLMFEFQMKYEKAVASFKKAISFALTMEEIEKYQKAISRCKEKEKIIKIG